MTGIVGSGFGLYGYLPAVVAAGNAQVGLLTRSYAAFNQRPELQFCKDAITWFESEAEFFRSVTTLIFSVPPFVQVKYATQLVRNENIQKIVLEKPLAPTPKEADHLLMLLQANHKQVRVGYIFLYTWWAQHVTSAHNEMQGSAGTLTIDWFFRAHHYKNDLENWKRYHHMGGSVLRFFGIQLIALLTRWGYRTTQSQTFGYSEDDLYQWKASFIHYTGGLCTVNLNSNSEVNCFNVLLKSEGDEKAKVAVSLPDPFGGNTTSALDKRASILSLLISDFDNKETGYDFYFAVNSLWSDVERINQVMINN